MLPQSNVNVNLEPGFFDNNIIAATPDVAVPSTITSVVAASLPSHRPPFEEVVGVGNSNDHHPGTDSNSDPTSVIVSITMTPSPTSTPPAAIADGSPMDAADNPTECQLLGSFAILVQLALGGLALLSLVYKRWRERPQRPVKIWFFDASKQVFGSVLVHGANVFMSLLTSGRFEIEAFNPASAGVGGVVKRGVMMLVGRDEPYVPNPCSFYLLNLGIDTTIGIPILIVIVRATTALVSYTPLGQPAESIQSGNYGNPPNAWWWFKQSIIYFFGLMGMKICVLVMFMAVPWLPKIGDWALGWTEGNEKLQIVFVMMLFPLIMNALQYYIIDSYIKKQIGSEDECEAHDHGAPAAQTTAYNELSGSETESFIADDSDEDDPEATPTKTKPAGDIRRKHSLGDLTRDEYDPDTDGDSQTVIGSSSSHISTKGVLQKDLLPKE